MSTQMQRAANGGPKSLKAFLESPDVAKKLGEVATQAMKAEDLIRLANMAASRQPELAKCAPHTVLRALMDAAALGIKPGGLMGRGYLVPRKNHKTGEMECCFDPGWRGLVDIARRGGKIRRIEAIVVYDNDEFSIVRDPFTRVHHSPTEGETGNIRAAFAIAEFTDGATQIEVVMKRDLDKIRRSSASQNGPWATWPEEMSRKSAVRRLCKYLPYDPMLEKALEAATDADTDMPVDISVASPEPAKPRSKQLAEKVRQKAQAQAEEARAQELDPGGPEPDPSDDEYQGDDPDEGQ